MLYVICSGHRNEIVLNINTAAQNMDRRGRGWELLAGSAYSLNREIRLAWRRRGWRWTDTVSHTVQSDSQRHYQVAGYHMSDCAWLIFCCSDLPVVGWVNKLRPTGKTVSGWRADFFVSLKEEIAEIIANPCAFVSRSQGIRGGLQNWIKTKCGFETEVTGNIREKYK